MSLASPALLARRRLVLADLLPGARLRDAALVLGAAAFVGLSAQVAVSLPFTPVPLTMQPFAVLLAGATLGLRRSAAGMVLYVLAAPTPRSRPRARRTPLAGAQPHPRTSSLRVRCPTAGRPSRATPPARTSPVRRRVNAAGPERQLARPARERTGQQSRTRSDRGILVTGGG